MSYIVPEGSEWDLLQSIQGLISPIKLFQKAMLINSFGSKNDLMHCLKKPRNWMKRNE